MMSRMACPYINRDEIQGVTTAKAPVCTENNAPASADKIDEATKKPKKSVVKVENQPLPMSEKCFAEKTLADLKRDARQRSMLCLPELVLPDNTLLTAYIQAKYGADGDLLGELPEAERRPLDPSGCEWTMKIAVRAVLAATEDNSMLRTSKVIGFIHAAYMPFVDMAAVAGPDEAECDFEPDFGAVVVELEKALIELEDVMQEQVCAAGKRS